MDQDTLLKIDHADLDEALARDADGSWGIMVQKYLADWKSKVQAELNKGLPKDEFESLSCLAKGMESADRILLFLIATKANRSQVR